MERGSGEALQRAAPERPETLNDMLWAVVRAAAVHRPKPGSIPPAWVQEALDKQGEASRERAEQLLS